MLDLSKEASNTMEVIKITLHLAFLMRQSWHQFHSNHKHRGSWLSHLENVDKCVKYLYWFPRPKYKLPATLRGLRMVPLAIFKHVTFLPHSPLLILQGPLDSDL